MARATCWGDEDGVDMVLLAGGVRMGLDKVLLTERGEDMLTPKKKTEKKRIFLQCEHYFGTLRGSQSMKIFS